MPESSPETWLSCSGTAASLPRDLEAVRACISWPGAGGGASERERGEMRQKGSSQVWSKVNLLSGLSGEKPSFSFPFGAFAVWSAVRFGFPLRSRSWQTRRAAVRCLRGGELVTNPGPQGLLGRSETALGIVGSGIQQTLNAAKSSKNLMGLKLFWVGYLGRAA